MTIENNDPVIAAARRTVDEYRMLDGAKGVLVAVSGGSDSMCLLHVMRLLLQDTGITLGAVHVNHMIRGKAADSDEEFVKNACMELGIPCSCYRRDVPAVSAQTSESEEECGRRLRYEIFTCAPQDHVVAVAHNMNDSAETVLFNLARGTGMKGLGGIPPVRDRIIRPLIDVSKDDILSFCERYGIGYVTDATNDDTNISRNRIRHAVIPQLTKINPAAIENIARCSKLVRNENELLEDLARELLDSAVVSGKLMTDALQRAHPVLRSKALRLFLTDNGVRTAEYRHIDFISDNTGKDFSITLPGGRILNGNKDLISFVDSDPIPCAPRETVIDTLPFETCFLSYKITVSALDSLPQGDANGTTEYYADLDKTDFPLSLTGRRDGDSLKTSARSHTKSFKKLCGERKIGARERSGLPVIRNGDGVPIVIHPFGTDLRFRADATSKNILRISIGGCKDEQA
ncbi:MAG: tRNA lysidine(34) synthetase TilS [Clostridiales bacterium]|nr:tRNA lysidine(34) synthetase TilS [Clostridiales bacterium]